MIQFPEIVFYILVIGALAWTALGFFVLVALLIKDAIRKEIW